ncbi:MAG: nucleotidyl transferase AbiEii/AbiGii toxin family protein [Deltaproteobacteria bacterium]|nr:nucleotidyl transferase AbiEii/AbiGii toxin family protein [Deltaproteobacteria bacterium]
MKDHLLQITSTTSNEKRYNIAREYLQVYLLRLLHTAGAFRHLSFVGGTALRLLHRLPRFSEDLDFSTVFLHEPNNPKTSFDVNALFSRLTRDLQAAGYNVSTKAKSSRTVASAFFRYIGIPYDIGWTKDQRLSMQIKLEIDCEPPEGAVTEVTLMQKFYPVALRHNDLASLFAGKIHAILCRPYNKGRDWFDLVWFLTDKRILEPNLAMLTHALAQTHAPIHAVDWREAVCARLHSLDWAEVMTDLQPFLERPDDLAHLEPALIEKALSL